MHVWQLKPRPCYSVQFFMHDRVYNMLCNGQTVARQVGTIFAEMELSFNFCVQPYLVTIFPSSCTCNITPSTTCLITQKLDILFNLIKLNYATKVNVALVYYFLMEYYEKNIFLCIKGVLIIIFGIYTRCQ